MVACIRWPREDGTKFAISGFSAYVTGQTSDKAVSASTLSANAMGVCRETEVKPDSDCTCQAIDRNGSNVLYVR